ncbi:MAG: hypothetical protein ABIS14_15865 [Sphingomonas sp.]
MIASWSHIGPTVIAAFLASMVEFVEALTVVLAVGVTRGWKSALGGTGVALLLLALLVVIPGPALSRVPLQSVQLVVGMLLLLFGMRWLRKAILRSACVIALHDEMAAYAKETEAMRAAPVTGSAWDSIAVLAAFKITMLEGIEVVFIVIALGTGGADRLMPAIGGALAALAVVIVLGLALRRPLSAIPENALKFVVGLLLSAFGTFWTGEGLGIVWPGADWSILGLIAGFAITAALAVGLARAARVKNTVRMSP